ncbi:MAG: TM2 domain-containing protein [Ignavibacteriales bacterium]|nr:TM2 domain-containing protein [Ignavibacteriales bacterium]
MDQQKVDLFLMTSGKYFEGYQLASIKEKLTKLDDAKLLQLQSVSLRDPIIMLIVSLIGGHFGIDRFVLGEVGLGVAKLLTCGGFGIWTIVDWFLIMGRTREINMQNFQQAMY